ncbi:MAG: hypothetical protein HWQ38_26355 [Nostoc sp. NMS7]|nr:hypothetical protein [Nostoc sp. NMS7]
MFFYHNLKFSYVLQDEYSLAIALHSSSQLIQVFYFSTYQPHHPYTTSIL